MAIIVHRGTERGPHKESADQESFHSAAQPLPQVAPECQELAGETAAEGNAKPVWQRSVLILSTQRAAGSHALVGPLGRYMMASCLGSPLVRQSDHLATLF